MKREWINEVHKARRKLRTAHIIPFVALVFGFFQFQGRTLASSVKDYSLQLSRNPETASEMVNKAKLILLVETIEKRPGKESEHFDFKFKVIRVIKGEYKAPTYLMKNVLPPGFSQLLATDEKNPPNAIFDHKRKELRATFGLHEKYLIIAGSKNAFGYQKIRSVNEDAWLKKIETLVGNSTQ